MFNKTFFLMIGVCLGLVSAVIATPVTISGAGGLRSASATFDDTGGMLVITLTNTATVDVTDPTQILTALFFDSSVPLSLTPVSVTLASGSTVLFGTTDPGNVVGGEWAYKAGLSGAPGNRQYGISSAGLGLVGPSDLFPGSNLQGPSSPDGLQYGITTAVDNPITGNSPVVGANALIKNSIVIVLSGLPTGFDASTDISNAWFQYGTALADGGHTPEPTVALLFAAGGLVAFRRRARAS